MAARKPRRRRSVDEARTAILDAAEAVLRDEGPSAIRLQDVARRVGVSHPTVLHHFGSREALLDAVVARSLQTIHQALAQVQPDEANVRSLFEFIAKQLERCGRIFFQLSLAGYSKGVDSFGLEPLIEFIHSTRKELWAADGRRPSKEDTHFTVMLAALSLLSLSVLEPHSQSLDGKRFRAWLARVIHQQLDRGLAPPV